MDQMPVTIVPPEFNGPMESADLFPLEHVELILRVLLTGSR